MTLRERKKLQRDPKVMQTFFWAVYGIYRSQEPDFVKGRHHGRLSRFRLRNIYAIDSTTILLLTHLVLRWLKYRSGATCSYPRFAALVRAIVWLKKDAMAILAGYGIAPPPDSGGIASGMPYLPGFEKMFLKSVG